MSRMAAGWLGVAVWVATSLAAVCHAADDVGRLTFVEAYIDGE